MNIPNFASRNQTRAAVRSGDVGGDAVACACADEEQALIMSVDRAKTAMQRALRLFFTSLSLMAALMVAPTRASTQILDKAVLFSRQTSWDNRDWDWFAARIPVFESPD